MDSSACVEQFIILYGQGKYGSWPCTFGEVVHADANVYADIAH